MENQRILRMYPESEQDAIKQTWSPQEVEDAQMHGLITHQVEFCMIDEFPQDIDIAWSFTEVGQKKSLY